MSACQNRALQLSLLVLGSLAQPSQHQHTGECGLQRATSSPKAGAHQACCWGKPCSVQPRTPGKDAEGPTGPSASRPPQPRRGAQGLVHPEDGGLAPSSAVPAQLPHFAHAEASACSPGLSSSALSAPSPFHFPEISKSHCSCQGS